MRDLTVGNEAKLIFKFAFPMILGNILQQLYNVVDSIIVGHVLGKEALAAVGASFPVFYALIAFMIGIGSGATVVISQFYGAKQYEKVRRTITTIFIVLFFASIVIMIVALIYSKDIFELLNVDESILSQATDYFSVYMTGMIAFFGFNAVSSVLRGLGDSKTPLRFMIYSTILNVVLDLLFIMVFKWGIKGAALATVIAQFITFIFAIIHLQKQQHIISFNLKKWVLDLKLLKQSLRIGLPTAFQQTFIALGMMALIRIVNNFGPDVLAAYTAAGRIDSLSALPALNLASALSAFVGQNLGAGRLDRIKKGLWASLFMAWTISLLVMAIVYFYGEDLMKLFTVDEAVIKYGANYLLIVSSFYLLFSTMFVLHGALRGAGATLVPMFISLFALWLIRIPVAVFFSEKIGVSGIWWAIPAGWIAGVIGSIIYYVSGKWKNKGVITSES